MRCGVCQGRVRQKSVEGGWGRVKGVDGCGYDETSLTSLSTADYSCITPLVKKVMGELRLVLALYPSLERIEPAPIT